MTNHEIKEMQLGSGNGDLVLAEDQCGSSPIVGHGAKFDRKKEQAIAALVVCGSVEAAARQVGIGTQTLYRWMKNREFEADFEAAKRVAADQVIAILRLGAPGAAVAMVDITVEAGAPASTRLKAADLVLRHVLEATEREKTEKRRAELESNRRFELEVARVEGQGR